MREIAIVAVLASATTAYIMSPLFGVAGSHFPMNAGDAAVNAWVLAWGGDRLAHGLLGFWSPPIFYPYSNTLAYSENLLGITAVVAPVQWWWSNPTLTYNVAFLLSFVVSAVSGFLLARDLTGSRTAGLVAGFGFAFTPYRWAQLTHLQVLWAAWLPLVLWTLHRALRVQRWSWWALFVGALLLQVLAYGYSAFQAAVAVALIVGASLVGYGVDAARVRRMALSALIVGLLLVPAMAAYYHVWSPREPTPGDLVNYSADLSSYLNVFPDLPDARWLPGMAQDEGHLFPGAAVVILALIGLVPTGRWRPVTRWRWVYAVMALLAVLLSLGPEPRVWGRALPIPAVYEWLLSTVPLFSAMRVPARFGMLAILACTVLAAMGFQRVMAGAGGRWRLALTAVVLALIVWEGYGGPLAVAPTTVTQREGDDLVDVWLAEEPPGPVLNLPMAALGNGFPMRQQYGALRHGHPIVDGISRLDTPLVEFLSGSVSPFAQPELLPDAVPFLRALGVRYVLMRSASFRDPAVATRMTNTFAHDTNMVERGRFGDVVAWEIAPEVPVPGRKPGLVPVPREHFSLSASHSAGRLPFAVDGDPRTRWLTGRPQDGSEWVEIAFDRPRSVAGIDVVVHSRSLGNYPRILEIVAYGAVGGGPEVTLYRGSILGPLGQGWRRTPEQPVVSITFPPHMTSRVKLRQQGHASPWFWAIDELVLWEDR